MIPAKRWRSWVAVTLLGSCLPLGARAAEPKVSPADTAALRALEQRVRAAARKVVPAVVAVEGAIQGGGSGARHSESCGSGVIISADGLVLSQYHVSHMRDQADPRKSRKPGEHTTVILHDGRRCEAELLGADRAQDLSLLRLLAPGPYPFTPLDGKATVRLGDGILKLGHPLGYRPGRPPVVRFGHVLFVDPDTFVADCLVAGGDSGGPLFDLDGRLVGIIRNSGMPEAVREAAVTARRVDSLFACSTCPLIRARIDAMRRGEIVSEDRAARHQPADAPGKAAVLPVERWSQGATTRAAYRDAVRPARS
ncbi:MAG TPA: serine protease, partial [Gemmataceae bacterium]|nr:serine protease [Gemmataceae bacterium]